jgi:Tfp pilus assembly protein PilX
MRAMQPKLRVSARRREEGVVLLVALITLVAMTLAGIGIMRSIDAGTMVAGNIGFRQAAVASGDTGIEAARTWLLANRPVLNDNNPALGYYSTRQDNLDLTGNRGGLSDGVDWDGTNVDLPVKAFKVAAGDGSGNTIYYLIHRLCSVPGSVNAPAQSCATASVSGVGSSQDAPDYSSYALRVTNQIYYRVTTRVDGPKNTVSYVQAVILL